MWTVTAWTEFIEPRNTGQGAVKTVMCFMITWKVWNFCTS